MKLAIFSDSHGHGDRINQVVQELSDIDYILYAGDVLGDLKEVQVPEGTELIAVQGNCDSNQDYPEEEIIDLGKTKVLLTHGHKYRIKWGLDRLYYRAKEVEAKIVVFGHTHYRYATKEANILFFNPGSIALPRDNRPPSYGIIELLDDKLFYSHHNFG